MASGFIFSMVMRHHIFSSSKRHLNYPGFPRHFYCLASSGIYLVRGHKDDASVRMWGLGQLLLYATEGAQRT